MMGGFYKCFGQSGDDGFFLPEQIKKLERPEEAPIAANLNMASLSLPAAKFVLFLFKLIKNKIFQYFQSIWRKWIHGDGGGWARLGHCSRHNTWF
jgi:hypothetical protein